MIRRYLDGSEKRVGGCDIFAVYVDVTSNYGMKLRLAMTALERVHRNDADYFRIPSPEAQNSVSNGPSPV